MSEETAWLIERNDLGAPRWLRFGPMHRQTRYVTDANEAHRFARKADAEAFILHFECSDPVLRATEHKWIEQPPPAAKPRALTQAELEKLCRQPETTEQIIERVSQHLRAEIREILAQANGSKQTDGDA